MTLYEIIKALQEASGSNAKKAILQEHSDNGLLKEYLRVTLDPRINFYITEKTFPKFQGSWLKWHNITETLISDCIEYFANRKVTGQEAKDHMQQWGKGLDKENQELFRMMLLKDIKAGVGASIVNKIWPGLIFEQPYMRCSLPKHVHLSEWPWQEGVYSQVKADGMYAAGSKNGLITRNGNKFPKGSFPNLEAELQNLPEGLELNGELTIYRDGKVLERKVGNGILNSVLQGEILPEGLEVKYEVWDIYGINFNSYNYEYWERFNSLNTWIAEDRTPSIRPIETLIVYSQQEAAQHMQECLQRGLEGTVLKHPHGLWKDGTSKHCIKYKVVAEVELECWDIVRGSGKYTDCVGAIRFKSSDGSVMVDCGTGLSDMQRSEYWKNKDKYIGKIASVTCNDVLTKEGSDILSLFLPVFVEWRNDKSEANSAQEIKDIVEDAKGGK